MTISRLRPLVLLLCLASAFAVSTAHARRAPRPRTRTCDISSVATTLGPTSVSSLKVTGTTCAAGKSVVRAFHACRLANGVSGRCVRRVEGYACGEIRSNTPVSFSATATCTKRGKKVVHRYTQNL